MTVPADTQIVRIPNLPMGHIVDDQGLPTDDELTFRQTLITNLQKLFGNDGVVLPNLTTAEIDTIVNAQNSLGQYTCSFGTLFYDITTKQIFGTVEDPVITGKPIKKLIV